VKCRKVFLKNLVVLLQLQVLPKVAFATIWALRNTSINSRISLRLHFDVTSISLRFHFDSTSISVGFHIGVII